MVFDRRKSMIYAEILQSEMRKFEPIFGEIMRR